MRDAPRALSAFMSTSFPRELPLARIDSLQGAEHWIRGAQERWSQGSSFTWSVERLRDRLLVGQVTLTKLPEPGRLALAFWIHPDCWGQGFATEAAGRAVGFAFTALRAAKVWAGAADWNAASAKVLQRLGMQHVADNADGYRVDGEPVATKEYEIGRDEWQSAVSSPFE
jgi:RimJ/RimL family protein N-acetyltransferase